MSIIKAVLGPTNTGKTHYAVERMLAHASGAMGFPLRLLAREVYDRVVAIKGKSRVALVTGEERIVPKGARYFLCTAEAMPREAGVEFVAIDEIQMAADPERGHVFTEHLLYTRGLSETLLLGSDTMRPLIQKLLPDAEIVSRPRLSTLSYAKPQRLQRLPRRSAIVGFSAADVYGLAELARRQKGGVAIVMGALSPRTRNAQVGMYQSGEADYLVATDAIGMGLNMDIGHVAFAGLSKFDGRTFRHLMPAEAAQIAGRAGRFEKDGTFSTLSGTDTMDPGTISRIEDHTFEPVRRIVWRNHRLDFSSIESLTWSLEAPPRLDGLMRAHDAVDVRTLKALAADPAISALASGEAAVRALWDACQVPDFRKLHMDDHLHLVRRLYEALMGETGTIPHDWIAREVKRLDNVAGDIDTLAGRIASIRVWTYISHKKSWLADAAHWAHVTRGVEDKLSDALHEQLTQRFVDRRTAVLMRSLRQRGELSVSIDNETNQVSVEGHDIGELHGFSFKAEPGTAGSDQRTLEAAAQAALGAEMTRRAKLFANVGYKTLSLDFSEGLAFPRLLWEGAVVATVHDSGALFAPRAKLARDVLLEGDNADLVLSKAQEWLDERVTDKLGPLVTLARELNGEVEAPEGAEALSGAVRGIAYRLVEGFGVLSRAEVASELKSLDQDARKGLRRFGIRIGAFSLYMPLLLKPHATELRLMMWAMKTGQAALPPIPTPGMVWVEAEATAPVDFYNLGGFRLAGKKAVRMDMMERLADAVRPLGSGGDWFEVTPEIMGLVGLSGEDFAAVMQAIGYGHEIRSLPVVPKTATPVVAEAEAAPAAEGEEAAPAATEESTPAETPAEVPAEAAAEGAEPEMVERYVFHWAPARRPRPEGGDRKRSGGKPNQGGKRHGGGEHRGAPRGDRNERDGKPRGDQRGPKREARPEKPIDPDSPFAALAGLKDQLSRKK